MRSLLVFLTTAVLVATSSLASITRITFDPPRPASHAPGPVDVGVTFLDGTTYVAKNIFRYYDRNTFDPAVFEPVLVPVFFSGAGAYGAQWVSELTMQDSAGNAAPLDPGQYPHGYLLH